MTHTASHIVISFATPVEVAKVKCKAWHVALALFVIGVIVGANL